MNKIMGTMVAVREEEIWKQEHRGGYPDPRSIALSGFESLRRALAIGGPRPPISHLTGLVIAEIEPDHATFEMPGSDWFLSSQDHVSVGPLMMLADAAFGCGVMIKLPPLTPYTTSELSMTFLKPCRAGGTLRATGVPLYEGNPLSISQAWVEDGYGERVAFGTSSCFAMPKLEAVELPPEPDAFLEPEYELPDPHLREPSGATIPWDVWQTMTGLEILHKQIAGELPQPPIHYLTGLTLKQAAKGSATFSLPASRWLTSPIGTVQGGALAMIAHAALASAVMTTLDTGSAYRPVDVKVNFLRPCFPTGEDLVARGVVTHRGRTLAVATSDLVGPDGKTIVTATGATMIMPNR